MKLYSQIYHAGIQKFFPGGEGGGASVIIKNLDKPKKKPNYQNYEILNP